MKVLVIFCVLCIADVLAHDSVLHTLGTIVISDTQPKPGSSGRYYPSNDCDEETCSGRLWIFFSDSNRVKEWGTINNDNNMGKHTKDVACHQLGYKESVTDPGRVIPPLQNDTYIPVWITGINCDQSLYFKNILQCEKSLYTGGNNHLHDVILHCGGGKLHTDPTTYLDGEVFLSPPDEKPDGMQTSIGVVQIKLRDNVRSINIKQPTDVVEYFSSVQRNVLCQQMGFIGAVPDSVYSVSALQNRFTFTKHERSSWFSIDNLNDRCMDPVPCFSCCYDYPQNDSGCPIVLCTENRTLVIACFYDTVTEQIHKQENCSFSSQKLSGEACGSVDDFLAEFLIFFFFSLITLILCILFGIFLCIAKPSWLCKCCSKKSDYKSIEENKK